MQSRAARQRAGPMNRPPEQDVAVDFPFESRFVDVLGVPMHYVEAGAGSGPPVLFLHGNPTSSYLWRNVIPHVAPYARCIAPDLVGMGRSGKPDSAYRFFDHYAWIERFIDALGLGPLVIAGHDWGSALGFHLAAQRPGSVRGLAFLEAILGPARWADFPWSFRLAFALMRAPAIGWILLGPGNAFVEQVLPRATIRRLGAGEMAHYRAPFRTIASRRPLRQWPREIPLDGRPADVAAAAAAWRAHLVASPVPKLLLHAHPGGIVRERELAWCRAQLSDLESVHLGAGIHYLQEDHPHRIGVLLADWYRRRCARYSAGSGTPSRSSNARLRSRPQR